MPASDSPAVSAKGPQPTAAPGVPLSSPGPTRPTAPLWLRLLVLGAVGLALAVPVPVFWFLGPLRADAVAAAHAAREFLEGLRQANQPQLVNAMVPGVNPIVVGAQPAFFQLTSRLKLPFLDYQVDIPTVAGDKAEAHFTLLYVEEPVSVMSLQGPAGQAAQTQSRVLARQADGQQGILHIKRIDRQWRVSGLTFPVKADGTGPNASFHPVAEQSAYLSAATRQAVQSFQSLTAVDARRFDKGWQVNLAVQDRPAREVLLGLVKELGLALPSYPPQALDGLAKELRVALLSDIRPAALGRPVSVKLAGKSRLEAIEEVCRQVGIYPQFRLNQLLVVPRPRPWPAAFAGPFLVEIEELKEFPPDPIGTLKLNCFAAGLPVPVADLLRSHGPGLLTIQAITAGSQDLYHADNQPYYKPTLKIGPVLDGTPAYQQIWFVPLKNLFRDLDTIPLLRGRVRVPLPGRMDEFRFEPLRAGVTRKAGEASWTLRKVESYLPTDAKAAASVQSSLEFTSQGVDSGPLYWMAFDGSGNPLRWGQEKALRSGSLRLLVPVESVGVVLKVFATGESIDYAFELRDIPLKQRAPRQIEPARFPGQQAPVTVEVVNSAPAGAGLSMPAVPAPPTVKTFPGITLKITNHSQKAVEKIHLTLTYFDADGRALKEVRHTAVNSFLDYSSRLAVLVAPRSSAMLRLQSAERPEGTKTVAAHVTAVMFGDAAVWSP
jgi:hypothetical protein